MRHWSIRPGSLADGLRLFGMAVFSGFVLWLALFVGLIGLRLLF